MTKKRPPEQMADWTESGWVPRPGWRFKVGSTTRFERIPEDPVVEPADPDWWRRPFAGHAPPPGASPARPWFAPEPGVWVDEAGFRWPVAALPSGAQLPTQPTGDEPMFELTRALADIEKGYWVDNEE